MKISEDLIRIVENFLSELSSEGYESFIAMISPDREAGFSLTDTDDPALGIHYVMLNLDQDRYDQLIADVESRRHR